MYIDIHILYYLLKEEPVFLYEKEPELPFRLSNVQQLIQGKVLSNTHKLYVCTWEEYASIQNHEPATHFAISGEADSKHIIQNNHHALVFPNNPNIPALIDLLQEKWEKYTEWYDHVMELIHQGKSLQEIFNAGVSILDFPVALFDKYSILLATAGDVPEVGMDSVWDDVLENHRFPSDEISPTLTRQTYESMIKNIWPVMYYSQKHQEYHLTSAIILQNQFFGIIGASLRYKFNAAQMSLYWQIKSMLEWVLMQNVQQPGRSEEAPYYIERLLSGYSIEESTVAFQLNSCNWKMDDEYHVICMKPTAEEYLYADDCMRFLFAIRELFPIAITFYYENSITCIVKTFGNPYKTSVEFTNFLKKHGLRAGVSLTFKNFMHLEYAYIQCKHALLSSDSIVAEFKDIYHTCLIKTLEQATSLKSLCHPTILEYWKKGHEREREYIQCLKVYLQNGRSITDASKKLSLHRNTLIYRLDYMSKLLNVDLKSDYIEDDILLLLTFSCDIVEYLENVL